MMKARLQGTYLKPLYINMSTHLKPSPTLASAWLALTDVRWAMSLRPFPEDQYPGRGPRIIYVISCITW